MSHSETSSRPDLLEKVREMVGACMQCGTCSGTCPNEFAMPQSPRVLWGLVAEGDAEAILRSGAFILCSSCYHCTLRCPRGLPLTEAMATLKQLSARENPWAFKSTQRFYRRFMDSVRRHGRVSETEFMTLYFLDLKNPFVPLRYLPLGARLMLKGKVRPEAPSFGGKDVLGALFEKARELEGRP